MENSSKVIFLVLLLLILSVSSFAGDPIEWTSGDYELRDSVTQLTTRNDVTVSMYQGGTVSWFYMYDDSEVTLYEHGASISYLYLHGSNTATFYGGYIGNIYVDPASTPEIYLNAYDVEFFNGPYPEIKGYWYDIPLGLNFFSIDLEDTDDSAFSYFHVIPEPATLALFALGGLLLRKRRK
ncbi:MAG: PEP-CTERM sorting domain-containing protein [Phycisphaerae bacterium]|jgi:hypothetical protein